MRKIPYKRRRLQLTNYRKRLQLVVSKQTRFVVRISNKYVNCQFINYLSDGDVTVVGFNSKRLADYGFKGGKNLQSSYLAGFAAGSLALGKGVKKAILDIGLRSSIRNSRVYAALSGVIDSGVKVAHGDGVLPSDQLLKKDKLKKVIEAIKKGPVKKKSVAKKTIKKKSPAKKKVVLSKANKVSAKTSKSEVKKK